jgi:hypothetical protein
MLQSLLETTLLETAAQSTSTSLVVGQIVEITSAGRALVDYPSNESGPVEAASILSAEDAADRATLVGMPALLWIDTVSGTPVVLGLVRDRLISKAASKRSAPKKQPLEVQVDGERVVLEAKQQIELRCGESSITLRKDGKILIKGTDLISRAARSNRIKGASVEIN